MNKNKLRDNRIIDASVNLTINHFGFDEDSLVDITKRMLRADDKAKARGKKIALFEVALHELSHQVINSGSVKKARNSSEKRYDSMVEELQCVALTTLVVEKLKCKQKWSFDYRCDTAGISDSFNNERLMHIKHASKLIMATDYKVRNLADKVAQMILDEAMLSSVTEEETFSKYFKQ